MLLDSNKVKDELNKNERTVAWLARQVGLKPESMQYIIYNRSVRHADKIANALGCNMMDLLIDETQEGG